jgi:site-specific DNA recombinase
MVLVQVTAGAAGHCEVHKQDIATYGEVMDTKRALLMTRLSAFSDDDDTTSPVRQEQQTRAVATARDWSVVGHAVDLGVSALKTAPLDRPELKIWLTEKINEWDVMIFWRLDRFVRSAIDMAAMISWTQKHQKVLVSASEPWFDLSTDIGQVLALLVSVFANMEAKATRARVLDSHRYLRTTKRWPGGPPPYGYLTVDNPDRAEGGKILVPDPEVQEVINWLFFEAEAGKAPNSLYAPLDEQGIPSPIERRRKLQGNPPGNPKTGEITRWSRQSVIDILHNEALLGFKTRDVHAESPTAKSGKKVIGREIVRDEQGMPVRCAEPIVDKRLFDNVQHILKLRGFTRTRTSGASMLLDIVFCAEPCGYKWHMAHTKVRGKPYNYYRCGSKSRHATDDCGSKAYRAEKLEQFVSEQFLMIAGDIEVTQRVFIPGSTHQDDMREIRAAMEFLTDQQLSAGPLQREVLQQKLSLHETRYAELAELPVVDPHWETHSLGMTYGDLWEQAGDSSEAKRTLLLQSGIKVYLNRREGTINVTHLASGHLEEKMMREHLG